MFFYDKVIYEIVQFANVSILNFSTSFSHFLKSRTTDICIYVCPVIILYNLAKIKIIEWVKLFCCSFREAWLGYALSFCHNLLD